MRDVLAFVSDVGGAVAAGSMLLAIAIGVGAGLVGLASDRAEVVRSSAIFVAGVVIGSTCMHAVERRRSASVESQLGYKWIDARYTYVINAVDPHRHRQETDVVIKAIRDGVRSFSNQYRWSGSGEEAIPKVTSLGHVISEIERSLAWRRYEVRLDPHLRRGETTTVSLVQELYDTDERFELFLAKSVHEPTKLLTLRVELPVRLTPDRAWAVEQVSAGPGPRARIFQKSEVVAVREGDRAVLEWRIARPVKGRSYQVRWTYAAGRTLYQPESPTAWSDGDASAR